MPKAAPSWCARCSTVHPGTCPNKPTWDKPVHRKSGRGGRPWRRKRARVFERDGYLCQNHKRQGKLVPVELHGPNAGVCDHIIAVAEGGTDDEENLQTICQECDKAKTQLESQRGRGYLKV